MSGASAVFITDLKGKVIISRNYRGDVAMTIVERFTKLVIEADESTVKPVFCEDGINFAWIRFNNLYFVSVTQRNGNAMMLLSYLYKLANVLKDYFKVTIQSQSMQLRRSRAREFQHA